jgi:DNA-directed RNA polymerase, mitochondrial
MDHLLQTKPRAFRKINGIGGDATEMLANLDASMRVGRFDRAASLLRRLAEFYPFHSPEYLELNNRYLQAMVSHMIVTRQNELVWALQKWFEVDMPRGGVRPNATTYAVMIRMALRMLHGTKRDRTVRRYWEMAKSTGVEEVLALPILSELELGELSKVSSFLS